MAEHERQEATPLWVQAAEHSSEAVPEAKRRGARPLGKNGCTTEVVTEYQRENGVFTVVIRKEP